MPSTIFIIDSTITRLSKNMSNKVTTASALKLPLGLNGIFLEHLRQTFAVHHKLFFALYRAEWVPWHIHYDWNDLWRSRQLQYCNSIWKWVETWYTWQEYRRSRELNTTHLISTWWFIYCLMQFFILCSPSSKLKLGHQ